MPNENKTYDLKIEKVIPKPPSEVFKAIGEGRLFLNCSADHEALKIDFKVGGGYSIEFVSYNMKNRGEFLEIDPYSKIVFTWCQDYDSNPTPDTRVSVELRDLGGSTALTLTHSGFSDLDNMKAHEGGWSGGLDDLSQEITKGTLRFTRPFPVPVEKLYAFCKSSGKFKGELFESVPNQKLVFNWSDSRVTLLLEAEDEKDKSSLELLHEGLATEARQKTQRAEWDSLLKQLRQAIQA